MNEADRAVTNGSNTIAVGSSSDSLERKVDLASTEFFSVKSHIERLSKKSPDEKNTLLIVEDKEQDANYMRDLLNPFFNIQLSLSEDKPTIEQRINGLSTNDFALIDIILGNEMNNTVGLEYVQMCKRKAIPYCAMSGDADNHAKVDEGHFFFKGAYDDKKITNDDRIERIVTAYLDSIIENTRIQSANENIASQFVTENSLYYIGKSTNTEPMEATQEIASRFERIVRMYIENPSFAHIGKRIIQNSMVGVVGDVNHYKKYSLSTVLYILKPVKTLSEIAAIAEAHDIGKKIGVNIVEAFGPLLIDSKEKKYQVINIDGACTYVVPEVHALATPAYLLLSESGEWRRQSIKKDRADAEKVASKMSYEQKLQEFYLALIDKIKRNICEWQRYNHTLDSRTKCKELDFTAFKKSLLHDDANNLKSVLDYYKSKIAMAFDFAFPEGFAEQGALSQQMSYKNPEGCLSIFSSQLKDTRVIVRGMDSNPSNFGVRTGIVNASVDDIFAILDGKESSSAIKDTVDGLVVHWDLSNRPSHFLDDVFRFANDYSLAQLRENGFCKGDRFDFVRDCISMVKKDEDIQRYVPDMYLISYYVSIRRSYLLLSEYIPKEEALLSASKIKKEEYEKNVRNLMNGAEHFINISRKDLESYISFLTANQKVTLSAGIQEYVSGKKAAKKVSSSDFEAELIPHLRTNPMVAQSLYLLHLTDMYSQRFKKKYSFAKR